MSEEERITKVKTEKNPKRVAACKKLAEYNRVRREKKQVDDETDVRGDNGGTSYTMVILTGAGIIAGLGCLYLKYKQDKREETKQQQQPTNTPPQQLESNKLRSLDD